jgi:hypothetical protein
MRIRGKLALPELVLMIAVPLIPGLSCMGPAPGCALARCHAARPGPERPDALRPSAAGNSPAEWALPGAVQPDAVTDGVSR